MTTPPHAAGYGMAPDSAVRLVRHLTRAALHDQAAVPVLAAVVDADSATCLPLVMTTARCGAGPLDTALAATVTALRLTHTQAAGLDDTISVNTGILPHAASPSPAGDAIRRADPHTTQRRCAHSAAGWKRSAGTTRPWRSHTRVSDPGAHTYSGGLARAPSNPLQPAAAGGTVSGGARRQ